MLHAPFERGKRMNYEPRCEACRHSRFSPDLAALYVYCEKLKSVAARGSRCDKFEREPGADDEKTGDRNER